MKKNNVLILLYLTLLYLPLSAQEQKEVVLKTDVSEATVFINGAQVLRKKTVDLLPGKTQIRFTDLSPYIDAKSVQVKIDGEVMVTSVNHQTNYIDSSKLVATKIPDIDKRIEALDDKIVLEKTNREVIKEELSFLNENKKIGGSNNGVGLVSLKETANYYRDCISALKKEDIELAKKITALENEKNLLLFEQKLGGGSNKKIPIGEVVVDVECKKAVRASMELTYYVNNAGWYPTYDIRAVNIDQPIELVYKANVRQNTKEDWKNIKLRVSSADPNLGNIVPELKTYYLNYYTPAPRYDTQVDNNQVSGVVLDSNNESLIGVTVTVKGSTIGTATDVDGRFSLALPANATNLMFTYIGYEQQTLPISKSNMTVYMKESAMMLDETVVVGYGSSVGDALKGKIPGVSVTKADKNNIRIRGLSSSTPGATSSIAMPTAQIETQTAVEFDIRIPYTIKSDNKNTIIEVDRYELPADYEYYSVPKVNKDAFLLANIVDWEKYNLLEGEANIFFENTYIGKTVLDVRAASDTLNISLGRDKNVQVSRDKVKDYNSKQFLGTKKEETRVWKITVKNNKKQAINMVVLDQIPVSSSADIEVSAENISDGILNKETGQVKWKMNLKSSDKKELELNYKVKYPKSRNLTIE